MAQHYSDPKRASDPHVLPDVETFKAATLHCDDCGLFSVLDPDQTGYADCPECGELGVTNNPRWYYWYCSPGCLPDSDPIGPFDNEDEALADAFTPCED